MSEYGGLVVTPGGTPGGQVTGPGQLQYGDLLMGAGTSAGWRELVGWRDAPEASVSDFSRPQAHGAYPGDVLGSSLVVTFTYLLRNTDLADRAAALAAVERFAPMDGAERMLAVNDADDGVWFRQARVIARHVPQDKNFRNGPLECSVQFLCADPRRYALTLQGGTVGLPVSSGGLNYPLDYPLDYGTFTVGSILGSNAGAVDTPLVATFQGPLTNPALHGPDWTMAFTIALGDGESLVVDTGADTALLNGSTDRMYTITDLSDPVAQCLLHPGNNDLSLTAASGTGSVNVAYRDARM